MKIKTLDVKTRGWKVEFTDDTIIQIELSNGHTIEVADNYTSFYIRSGTGTLEVTPVAQNAFYITVKKYA